jgi:N6-adenosine-specific RNA methylase IME4
MPHQLTRRPAPLPASVVKDRVVRRLRDVEAMLRATVRIEEVKVVLDVATAQQLFATRQKLGEEVIGYAHWIKIHALDRLGAVTAQLKKATGTRGQLRGRASGGSRVEPPDRLTPTLLELGITKKVAAVAQQLHRLPADVREAIAARKLTLAAALRQVRQADARAAAATLSPAAGVFDVIVVDPPWHYDRQPKAAGLRGEVDYATLSIEELKAITLPAAPNCVLWLWTTNAFMREAYELLEAWQFTPKTILTWDKVNIGLGEWLRNVTEHCLLAVRGRPVITLTNQSTLIREKRRQHSRKPEAFYRLVEQVCPGRKYEHFSRTPRSGWVGHGLEQEKFASV